MISARVLAELLRECAQLRVHRNRTLTRSLDASTIGARDDAFVLVSTRDKFREALTLVSYRD